MKALPLALIALVSGVVVAPTQTSAQPAPPDPPKAEIGFEERVRSEDWGNLTDFSSTNDDFRTQYRFRSRLWMTLRPSARVEVVAGIINENRRIAEPSMAFHGREVVFETLYVDWRLGSGWAVRAGRQNLMRGEGFVLFDGNPLDGSRTAYFNALDLYRSFGKSRLELLAISNPRTDRYLPRFNEARKVSELQRLVEWDERALGAYLTYAELPKTGLEAYAFYKTETGDFRAATHPLFQPDRQLGVVGGRVVRTLGKGFTLVGEAAYEVGSQDAQPGSSGASRDLRAWGGYLRFRKELGGKAGPSVSLAYIGLSGDDPATDTIEGWDPLFSRWPKWSELYIYSLGSETGASYWSNIGMWEAELRLTPAKWLAVRAAYYRMQAFESLGARGGVFGSGTHRGDLFQIRGDVTLGGGWRGHAVYEHLDPGNFYAGRDAAHYLRFEVIYTLKHAL
ncbi:MAG: alginate export family protein [Thermoanaerobaculaceae bacterium]|nr:alginate export family protein [Thermoanaerobaculaceae bacterium]MDI9621139.1 hypothetical protein [Acidobacteriota bacterium]NLH11313.1 alginate export family protein [Holophagae bacterium]HPW55688.1 hypothetical protein [Thermoanaerobaculaceae bacterium]